MSTDRQAISERIDKVAEQIEARLEPGLVDGRIDLRRLKEQDKDLHHLLDMYAASKTWRDDPMTTARDVAKLLEAQSKETPLGSALAKFSLKR